MPREPAIVTISWEPESPLSPNGIIVMGNEGKGISPDIEALINRGLVYLNWNQRALGTFTPFDWYELTEAGRIALEDERNG